jgi:hypothetical protein
MGRSHKQQSINQREKAMLQSSDGKMSADAIEILGMSIHELRSLARRLHILDYQYLTRKQLAEGLAAIANGDPTDLSSDRNRL